MYERFAEFARGLDDAEAWFAAAAATAIAAFALWRMFRALKRARLIEDTPTSLVRSAAQGYCELVGYGELMPGVPLVSPLTGRPCVWWQYSIEEKTGSGKNRHWRVIEHDVSGCLFALDDPTGRCIVDPDGAEVEGYEQRVWHGNTPRPQLGPEVGSRWSFGNEFRYTERHVAPGLRLYAIGAFETVGDPYSGSDVRAEIAARLAAWKKDQRALKARFDLDRDGTIDADEWEAARQAARREVEAESAEQALKPGVHLLRAPRDGRPFILSTLDQDALAGRLRWHAALGLLLGALGIGFVVALFVARGA